MSLSCISLMSQSINSLMPSIIHNFNSSFNSIAQVLCTHPLINQFPPHNSMLLLLILFHIPLLIHDFSYPNCSYLPIIFILVVPFLIRKSFLIESVIPRFLFDDPLYLAWTFISSLLLFILII